VQSVSPALPKDHPLRRILVVEDDLDLSDAVREILQDEGYEVALAANGALAMDALRRGPRPDLILLDLMMPESNGFLFRAQQRSDAALASIPVIVMTASSTSSERVTALGVAEVVRKPFEVDDLVAAIARVFRAAA